MKKHYTIIVLFIISTNLFAQRPAGRAPQVGEEAPLFTLTSLDDSSQTSLLSFRGNKPVVLFFGSYT